MALLLLAIFSQKFYQILIKHGEKFMSEENNTGNNLIWAITTLLVVAIIAGALYFTVLKTDKSSDKNIDIEIKAPAR